MSTSTLQGDMYVGTDRIGRRCSSDRPPRDGCRRKTAANAAEIVLIKQIASPVLAEREHQSASTVRRRDDQRYWIGTAEISILLIQRQPVRRCKEIAFVARPVQIWRQAKHGFAIAPGRGAKCVPSSHE